jgi:hypothetical protein
MNVQLPISVPTCYHFRPEEKLFLGNPDKLSESVQHLVNLLPLEYDLEKRRSLLKNIKESYSQNIDLTSVNLTPILNMLDESGPAFTCEILQLLSLTYNKKYTPVISRFIYSVDEQVREAAFSALTFIQFKPSSSRTVSAGFLQYKFGYNSI